MKASATAILAAVLLLTLFPGSAAARDGRAPRAVIVDGGGDTFEVRGDRPRRIRIGRDEGAWMGVRLIDIPPDLRAHYGAPTDAGVLVAEVEKDSPAGRAGVSVGDVVTAVDGGPIATSREVARAVRRKSAGETVQVDVVRNRSKKTLAVKVEERPRQEVELRDMARDLGRDLSREFATRPWRFEFDTDWNRSPRRDRGDVRKLQDRVEELEKRLKELEGKRGR